MTKAVRIDNGQIEVIDNADVNSLEWLQKQVGGYIEMVQHEGELGRGIVVYGNEEAKILNPPLEANVYRYDAEILAGPLVIVGEKGEYARGLTDDEIASIKLLPAEFFGLPVLLINREHPLMQGT